MPIVDDVNIRPGTPDYYSAPSGPQQQIAIPDAPVGTAPAYVATPAPPVGGVPSAEQMQQWILNSPLYKQGLENIQGAYDRNLSRTNEMYALNSKYSSPAQTFTPETIPGSFYDQIALDKEKAAHDWALQQKAIPELMAARGMLSSGQTGFEQGEGQYSYDTLLKSIDLQKKAREESVAQANARGAASVAQANAANAANRAITQQIAAAENTYKLQDLDTGLAQDRNKLLTDVSGFYQDLWWDGSQYVGPTV